MPSVNIPRLVPDVPIEQFIVVTYVYWLLTYTTKSICIPQLGHEGDRRLTSVASDIPRPCFPV